MGLFDSGIISRVRSLMASMSSDFKLAIGKQNKELKRVRDELQAAVMRIEASEMRMDDLQKENEYLRSKVGEIKRSWDTFEAIASDANKIRQLIVAFKRIKRELLENRRSCDLSVNMIEELKRENSRLLTKLECSTPDCKIDYDELKGYVASLKRELSATTIKSEQQERLIKSLKEKEERLVASLKRNF